MSRFLRADGNYDMDAASDESGLDCSGEPSLTVQSDAKDADINEIIRRVGLTGELPIRQRVPLMVDIDEVLDYRMCLERVQNAREAFASLPPLVRAKFENDPSQLVAFAADPENKAQLKEWGMLREVVESVAPAPPADVPA